MPLIKLNWNPTPRQLRQFSVLCLAALPVLAWMWSGTPTLIAILAGIGLLMSIVAWVCPQWISPVFIGVLLITAPIGMVVGELAMFLVCVIVFLPIGILFRLASRDRLQLKLDRQAKSYWQPKRQPKTLASYYRQS